MRDETLRLGGHRPLLDPETLAAGQKHLYDHNNGSVGRTRRLPRQDGRWPIERSIQPGPLHPGDRKGLLGTATCGRKNAALSERVRHVVILSIGSVWKASYEVYSRAAAARKAGLSEDTIGVLAAGEPATDLNEQEQVAQQFSLHLARDRGISDELYRIALRLFGEKGLVDMIMLAGRYHVVCSLLNAFAVSAPETDHNF